MKKKEYPERKGMWHGVETGHSRQENLATAEVAGPLNDGSRCGAPQNDGA